MWAQVSPPSKVALFIRNVAHRKVQSGGGCGQEYRTSEADAHTYAMQSRFESLAVELDEVQAEHAQEVLLINHPTWG